MRISDWSSDVCSSDLVEATVGDIASSFERFRRLRSDEVDRAAGRVLPEQRTLRPLEDLDAFEIISLVEREDRERRSEERREGQEGVSTCRSRWSAKP